MSRRLGRAFTLIELLVVITIIGILVSIGFAVIAHVFTITDRVQCANNLRQIGIHIIREVMNPGRDGKRQFPAGGTCPGLWAGTYGDLLSVVQEAKLFQCAAPPENSPVNPRGMGGWATCSYAYVGNMSPTYTCHCSAWCKEEGKQIWTLKWSGVDVAGVHTHDRGKDSTFKTLRLSDNLVWRPEKADKPSELYGQAAPVPTVPDSLDYDTFHTDDRKKFRTERALRQVPEIPEDMKSNIPLMMDIVVLKGPTLPAGATTWGNAHMYVSQANKNSILYANHCNTPAADKSGWGINILYADGQRVEWKDWKDIRVQVMAPAADTGLSADHYYYW